jgi:hypothetical protein
MERSEEPRATGALCLARSDIAALVNLSELLYIVKVTPKAFLGICEVMAIGDGYNPSTITNPGAQAAVDKLTSDPEFRSRYTSDDRYIRNFAVDQMEITQRNAAARSYYVPDKPSIDAAEARIKEAMSNPLFMERYNSNDPRVRGAAVDELSKLFFDKYGNRPNSDEPVENTPRPVASSERTASPSQPTRFIPLMTGPARAPVNDPYANMTSAEVYRNYGTAGLRAFNSRR